MALDLSSIPRSSLLGRLLRAPLAAIPDGMTVRVLQGPLRGARWITGSGTHGCWLGSYEIGKQRAFAACLAPGAVVFDIGANVGFYTLLASRLVAQGGQVVAFEPLPRNAGLLRAHVEMNACENVVIFEAAVAGHCGRVSFSHGHHPSEGFISEYGDAEVAAVSLDGLVLGGRARPPDLIKVDVEGAEFDVLSGGRALLERHRPAIFLATHGAGVHRRCLDLLHGLDYDVRPLEGTEVDCADELVAVPSCRGRA